MAIHTISTIQLPIDLHRMNSRQRADWNQLSMEWRQIYYLRNSNPQAYAQKQADWYVRFGQFCKEVSRSQHPNAKPQKLPEFINIAEKGGGKSIALEGADNLVSSLLYISTGIRQDLEQAEPKKKISEKGITLAQIEHEGDWNPPRDFPSVLEEASKKLNISVRSEPVKVDLKADAVFQYPFLYLTGHKSFSFSENQKERLRKYLSRGGFLWIDSCCAQEKFDQSVRSLLQSILPQSALKSLSVSHSVYHNPWNVQEVTLSRVAMQNDFTRASQYLEAVEVQNRIVVIYSSKCIGCGFGQGGGTVCGIQNDEAKKIFQNILFYTLTE
jgi:hypothetical protein